MTKSQQLGFSDGRTLGSEVRAKRLGFTWLAEIGAYVRVSDEGDDCYRIDVAPPDGVPGGRGTKKLPRMYRCWWENPDPQLRADLAAHITKIVAGATRPRRIRQHLAFVSADEDDAFVSWA